MRQQLSFSFMADQPNTVGKKESPESQPADNSDEQTRSKKTTREQQQV